MKQTRPGLFSMRYLGFLWFALLPLLAAGQQNVVINMAPIDGLSITPENIFSYLVQSSGPGKVQVTGTIHYRNSNLSLSYSFPYTLRQGLNQFVADEIHPQWQLSTSALQELFFMYKILPEGTFEYCVTIKPGGGIKETTTNVFDECLYHKSSDIFLINLVYPEDNAKLDVFNPMLSWVANYAFASELTYRIRVAEIKQGQNPVNAVMRNQPMYDESNLVTNSIVYPVYAKPLDTNTWYAWTVDAYYKGILLGGAETWRFMIPDSIPPEIKASRSFIDIKRETGATRLFAIGNLKLKYVLDDAKSDVLSLELLNADGQKCNLMPGTLKAGYG